MTDEMRKLLTEYLGECFHEWGSFTKHPTKNIESIPKCQKCGDIRKYNGDTEHRTFLDPRDMDALRRKLVEKGDWDDFIESVYDGPWDKICGRDTKSEFIGWLMDPERFCSLVGEWLGAEGRCS